jgi:5-methyltetrahydropteroyltriglutamate--homocysteine methyltransferase
MKRSNERILTTHVGSLPRPELLTDLLLGKEAGEKTDSSILLGSITSAVQGVVEKQRASGIDIPSDGEMPRVSFSTYIPDRMDGFAGESRRPLPLDAQQFPAWLKWMQNSGLRRARVYNAPEAVSEVSYRNMAPVELECTVFEQALAEYQSDFVEVFMTAASPGIIATTMMNRYYDTHQSYLSAIARQIRKEYRFIIDKGFTLQIDAPDVAMERAGFFQNRSPTQFLRDADMHIEALNLALEGIPREKVRLHACWGNRNSPHLNDVPCPDILPLLFRANVGALSLPFANPRHLHEIDSLKKYRLPEHMVLMPGVIETVTNYVEHPQVVAERICRAVAAVGEKERVIASTDCGFSTLAGDSFVAEDVVWAKMNSLVEGARLASGVLW